MIKKKTFATTILLSSIMMVAISGTTQNVYAASIFGSDQFPPGTTFHIQEMIDSSGSISTVDPDGGGCAPPGDLCSEWDLERNGVADGLDALAAFDAVRPGGPQLLGFLFISVVEFGSVATLQCSGEITSVADMTVLTDCIRTLTKDDQATDIQEAFQVTCADFVANPRDVHIIDLISDGEPTESTGFGGDHQAAAVAARDTCLDPLTGNVERIVALGVDIADLAFLKELVWPNNPPIAVVPPDAIPEDDGFVAVANTFDDFAQAFQNKLAIIGIPICELFPELPQCRVGGEFLPIDSTAMLMAGLSANMSLLVPIVAGVAGVGAYFIRTRMNKN